MDSHLENAVSQGFYVTEMAQLQSRQTQGDERFCPQIRKVLHPGLEDLRFMDD
jgi:hypothetical protein